jgi:transcriptional regulator with XRE-family HTH domain
MMHDSRREDVVAELERRAEHDLEIAEFRLEFFACRPILTSEVKVRGRYGCYARRVLAPQSPGPMIRALRHARRLSQEELAHRAEVSTRHLSCLESGRAKPSHAMVLALGAALDLPLRERNVLLAAAGFAPVYRMSPLEDPCMVHVHEAVSHILALHEPHPAVLMDRRWNVLRMNAGAMRLFAFCGVALPEGTVLNAYRVMFDPALGLKGCIVNFDALADAVLARLRTECDVDPTMRQLLGELELLRGRAPERPREAVPNPVALPVHVRRHGVDLRYFTTLTTLGTPLDVTAQELVIEGYFPMDEATRAFGQRLASEAGG